MRRRPRPTARVAPELTEHIEFSVDRSIARTPRGRPRRSRRLGRAHARVLRRGDAMAEEPPLNILLITCDQLRRDAVAAMGLETLAGTAGEKHIWGIREFT
jgi:hypothetical protein